MAYFALTNPSATLARGIENILIKGENSGSMLEKAACAVLSRLISVTVFPVFLGLELVLKRIPKALAALRFSSIPQPNNAPSQFQKSTDKIKKFALGIFFSPLGIRSPDGISSFFLKTPPSDSTIRPFGVELQYGKNVNKVQYPKSVKQLQNIIRKAKKENKQVSVIGAGMSQGPQTVPASSNHVVIHTKHLNKVEIQKNRNIAKVGAGATWEQVQIAANQQGKSVIVKQASDVFSIGGSIGINCHGWAHEYGAIASTVESVQIIDAEGNLKTLTPKDELFGCLFGTLGYFGVIVSVQLKLTDNEHLVEKTKTVSLDQFHTHYQTMIKGQGIPLFGGRLNLDCLEGNPLRSVEMVTYERDLEANAAEKKPVITKNFMAESSRGTRMERIGLQLVAHLSSFSVKKILSYFWKTERARLQTQSKFTRNEALHPPIKAFNMFRPSNLHTQWLQEYFIKPENLPDFLRFWGQN